MGAIASLDSLRCFVAAARALNFRQAARSVALGPTAFSQRIKALEEQLGRHHHVSVVLSCYAFIVAERVRRFSPSTGRQGDAHPIAVAA